MLLRFFTAALISTVLLVPSAAGARTLDPPPGDPAGGVEGSEPGGGSGGGLDRLRQAVRESEERLEEINERLEELDRRRELLGTVIDEVRASNERTSRAISRRTRAIERLETRIRRDTRTLEKLRQLFRDRAIAAFVSGNPTLTESFLDADGADDAIGIQVFLGALNDSDEELANRIDEETKALGADRRRQVELRDRLETEKEKLERLDETLESKRAELLEATLEAWVEGVEAEEAVEEALALADLVSAPGGQHTLDGRATCEAAGINVACDIAFDVVNMIRAAEIDGVTLTGSGWRSTERQIELRRAHCGGDVFGRPASACSPPTARPGSSQHERGLAIDFQNCSSRGTECFTWLAENAADHGFRNLPSEPWHWSTTGN